MAVLERHCSRTTEMEKKDQAPAFIGSQGAGVRGSVDSNIEMASLISLTSQPRERSDHHTCLRGPRKGRRETLSRSGQSRDDKKGPSSEECWAGGGLGRRNPANPFGPTRNLEQSVPKVCWGVRNALGISRDISWEKLWEGMITFSRN